MVVVGGLFGLVYGGVFLGGFVDVVELDVIVVLLYWGIFEGECCLFLVFFRCVGGWGVVVEVVGGIV